jgi:hypothetical protein
MQDLPREISDYIIGYLDYRFVIRYSFIPLIQRYLQDLDLGLGVSLERAYSLNNYNYLHYDDVARKQASQVPISDKWLLNDILHRYSGPAVTELHSNGKPKLEIYYSYGQIHRIGGPAYITYYDSGQPYRCWWGQNGISIRDNGQPTFEEYDINGNMVKSSIFEH